jgi:hypothetical protein
MIVSVQLADVGVREAQRLHRKGLRRREAPGLRHAELTTMAPLGGGLLPRPTPARIGLIGVWDGDDALDEFLNGHALARSLAHGWRVRLRPTHVFGAWAPLREPFDEEPDLEADEPAAVLTIGHLRLTQAVRFLRASAKAEAQAIADPALLASTGLARPPRLVATFSLWRTAAEMRAYARGDADARHRDASRAHAARPFHRESAFIRFRPYAAEGSWDGVEPLARAALAPASA